MARLPHRDRKSPFTSDDSINTITCTCNSQGDHKLVCCVKYDSKGESRFQK